MTAMRVTWDKENDLAHVYLVDEIAPGGVAYTIACDTKSDCMVNLDFDASDILLGIEAIPGRGVLPKRILDMADE